MRVNDILVSAFPKSGSTYLGFLIMAARLRHNNIPLRPTFYNIDWLLVDTYKMEGFSPAVQSMWRDGLGEFYKTHDRAEVRQNRPPNVIYLLRNPVDTLKSYWHFRRQLKEERRGVMDFLAGGHGCDAWCAHVRSWLIDAQDASQSLCLVEYEELCQEPRATLDAIFLQLGLCIAGEWLDEAVERNTLKQMRNWEEHFARRNPVYARYNLEFVRRTVEPARPLSRSVSEWTSEATDYVSARCDALYNSVRCHESAGGQCREPESAT